MHPSEPHPYGGDGPNVTEQHGTSRQVSATIGPPCRGLPPRDTWPMDLPILRGERGQLRPLADADRERIIEIRSTEEVAQRWRGDDLDEEFTEDLADEELHQFAIETTDGHVIGMIQFSEEEDPDYRHASIDIFIDPAVHRRRFAADSIVTLANYLFDHRGHHRLVIDPAANNEAAIACYAMVGFKPVGVMRSYERSADGSWSDGLLMDMIHADRQPE